MLLNFETKICENLPSKQVKFLKFGEKYLCYQKKKQK